MNLTFLHRFKALLIGTCIAWASVLSAWAQDGEAKQVPAGRPNILWITAEDMSATLGCYGDSYATTPNIDRLASESCRYTNAFATSPVCSPSRACLINACIAPHTGTHPMRSLFPLPQKMNGFPSLLRRAGYFTSNNVKTDYNTSSEERIIAASWDRNGPQASWHLRDPGHRFFSIHNLMTSHQSRTMVWPYEQFKQEVQSRLEPSEIHDPSSVPLPPYYPDTILVRQTLARYYDCVTVMDKEVGEILDRLDADGLADDTIVFFYSDHGSGMPRHKRALFDSGMHVPLLIRFPDKYQHLAPCEPGETTDRLVSFEDFGPTVLSLAGISGLPDFMRGKPFLGSLAGEPRAYVYGHRDRVDEIMDCARSIRSKRYLYIRNFMPHLGYHQPSAWVDQGEVKDDFYALAADSGSASAAQWQFLGPTRPREELYDCESDPMNLNNLAESPEHRATVNLFRSRLRRELIASSDLGFVPEIELWKQAAGTTPRGAAAARRFDVSRLMDAAELVGGDDFEAIEIALADQDPCVRYWAAVACSASASLPSGLANRLRELFSDPSEAVRIEAAGAIAQHLGDQHLGDQAAFDTLLEITAGSNETTILHAARKLELLANPRQREQIQALANRFADAPGDVAWCIRFTTSAYLRRVK